MFSAPLFEVTNRLYYNRRFNDYSAGLADDFDGIIGRVQGYEYGPAIENIPVGETQSFNTEVQALSALFEGRIDVLPIAEGVSVALMDTHFSERIQLIRPVPGIATTLGLHLIAPNTRSGVDLINSFDATHARLKAANALPTVGSTSSGRAALSGDIVGLIASEGFPIVVGSEIIVTDGSYSAGANLAIPQGTRAVVIDWSDTITEPATRKQLYDTMMAESRVVILNGPHVGKELLIKNMHLSLETR